MGGLPQFATKFRSRSTDFVGCIRNLEIDHSFVDLMLPMVNHLSDGKCIQNQPKCTKNNPCKMGHCIDGLRGPRCVCSEGFIGEHCQTGWEQFSRHLFTYFLPFPPSQCTHACILAYKPSGQALTSEHDIMSLLYREQVDSSITC